MRTFSFNMIAVAVMFLAGAAVNQAQAATGVGKAIISIGKVFTTSKDGAENNLKRRGKVFEGDTIKVGAKSRLQLRFVDNQLVVLKANTVFRIDEYKFKGKNDNNKSAALSLLKGGMRSVTGLIGKSARDKYKVRTPVATMGVRGTHFLLHVCSNDCGAGVQGLVGTVLEGEIELTNDGGTTSFVADQFFNVPSANDAPHAITNPPATLVSQVETESSDEESENDSGGGGEDTAALGDGSDAPADDSTSDSSTDTASTTITETTFTSGEQATVETATGTISTTEPTAPAPSGFVPGSEVQAPLNSAIIIAGIKPGVSGAGGSLGIEGISSATGLATVNMVGNQPISTSINDPMMMTTFGFDVIAGAVSIGTETGGDPMLGVNWGRWASNDIVVTENMSPVNLLNGAAFVYSDNLTPGGSIPVSGILMYNIAGAGPSFRDETGAVVTGNLMFGVNFTGQTINVAGTLSGNGRMYSIGSTPIALSALLGAGALIQLTGSCTGCTMGLTYTGDAGGVFVGPNAEGFIGFFNFNGTDGMGIDVGISGAGLGIGM